MSEVNTSETENGTRTRGTRMVVVLALACGCLAGIAVSAVFFDASGTGPIEREGMARARTTEPPVLFSVNTRKKMVALTFDDGPDPAYDYKILAILRRYGARATFFLEGRNAIRHPEVVQAEVAGGHEVANHTMNHRDMQFVSIDVARSEIEGAGRVIEEISGARPVYFRPPRGHLNLDTLLLADDLGYQVVMWSMGLERVKGLTLDEDADIVVENLRPGMVILAHDASPTRWWVPEVLPRMIEGIHSRGYRIVTLSELLRAQEVQSRDARQAAI